MTTDRSKLDIALEDATRQISLLTRIANDGGLLAQRDADAIAFTLARLAAAAPIRDERANVTFADRERDQQIRAREH